MNKFSSFLILGAFLSSCSFAEDVISKAKSSGSIVLGVRAEAGALSYALSGGQYGGFHVDLCRAIVADLEKAVKKKIFITYQEVNSQNRMTYIQNGAVDLECGSTTNTKSRQQEISFLNTTIVDEVRIAVKANSGINSIEKLNGKRVATTTGSTIVDTLGKNPQLKAIKFREILGTDHGDSFNMLAIGRADAFVMDGSVLAAKIATSPVPAEYKLLPDILMLEPLAIAISKNDPVFKKFANDTIANLEKSGELAKLWNKWFVQPIPPNGARVSYPLNSATKAAWANLNDNPIETYNNK